jgi:hypothetical protein
MQEEKITTTTTTTMSAVDKPGRGGEVELSVSSAVAVAVSSSVQDGNTQDVDEATTSRRANDNNDDDNNNNNNDDDMDDDDDDDDDDEEEEEEEGQTATREISTAMEHVFLIMQYRKLQRELNGPQKKRQKYHYGALAMCIVLVYCFLIGEQYIIDDDAATTEEAARSQLQISVDWSTYRVPSCLSYLVLFCFCFVSLLIIFLLRNSLHFISSHFILFLCLWTNYYIRYPYLVRSLVFGQCVHYFHHE